MDDWSFEDSVLGQLEVLTSGTAASGVFRKKTCCVLTACARELSAAKLLKSTADLPPALMDSPLPSAVDLSGRTRMRSPKSSGYERGLAFGWVCRLPNVCVVSALMMELRPGSSIPVLVLSSDDNPLLLYAPDAPVPDMENDWFGNSASSSAVEQLAFGPEATSIVQLRVAIAAGLGQFQAPTFVDNGSYHVCRRGALSLMRLRLPANETEFHAIDMLHVFAGQSGLEYKAGFQIDQLSLVSHADTNCVFDRVPFFDATGFDAPERALQFRMYDKEVLRQLAMAVAGPVRTKRSPVSFKRPRSRVPKPLPLPLSCTSETRKGLTWAVFGASGVLFTLFQIEGTWENIRSYIFGPAAEASLGRPPSSTTPSPMECVMGLGRYCEPPNSVLAVRIENRGRWNVHSSVLAGGFQLTPIASSEIPRHCTRWACKTFLVSDTGLVFFATRLGDVCGAYCNVASGRA